MSDDADRVAGLEQQVAAMQAQLAQLKAAAPTATQGNPQVLDLRGLLPADQAQRLQSVLGQLGSSNFGHDWQHQLSGLFGGAAAPGVPPTATAASVARLADPPRRVPFSLRLTVFTWSWYEAFCVLMGFVAPIALWGLLPASVPAGFIAALVVIAVIRFRRHGRRQALLRWGKVVDVTSAEVSNTGSYYAGLTYNNMIVPQAHGWKVDRRFYSGPATTTDIGYTVDGATGVLTMRGLAYANGVVLADSRRPGVALCVSQFPYSVEPDADGQLSGHLGVRTWIGILAELVLLGVLVAGAVLSVSLIWFG
ncbi:MAG: hypothetical protein JWO46_2652 [Nocardioidaceae bacterium]|nr:hypothetical protein [Nocardioidaceae bacterium]